MLSTSNGDADVQTAFKRDGPHAHYLKNSVMFAGIAALKWVEEDLNSVDKVVNLQSDAVRGYLE